MSCSSTQHVTCTSRRQHVPTHGDAKTMEEGSPPIDAQRMSRLLNDPFDQRFEENGCLDALNDCGCCACCCSLCFLCDA